MFNWLRREIKRVTLRGKIGFRHCRVWWWFRVWRLHVLPPGLFDGFGSWSVLFSPYSFASSFLSLCFLALFLFQWCPARGLNPLMATATVFWGVQCRTPLPSPRPWPWEGWTRTTWSTSALFGYPAFVLFVHVPCPGVNILLLALWYAQTFMSNSSKRE